jgi:hypothetical protein
MKKQFLISAILLSQFSLAQITITNSNMPSAGSSFLMDNATPPGNLDLNQTGANYTWDFSSLTANTSTTDSFVSVSSTPFAYQFFFNNQFLYPDNKADFAAASTDLNLPSQLPITVEEVINYYKKPADGFYVVGFGASLSGIPTSVRYNPIDRIYKFPLAYGNLDSNRYIFNISIPTIGTYGQNKLRINEVDGWGTLLMPNNNSYQVLRVKSSLVGTDTIYVDAFGFGFNFPSTSFEYKWIAEGIEVPVLQINAQDLLGTITANSVKYLNAEDQTGIAPYENGKKLNVFFENPSQQNLAINFTNSINQSIIISIIDMHGKIVLEKIMQPQIGNNIYHLDLSSFSFGVYQLRMQQEGYSECKKLVLSN